jgi:hypothetical protein
MACILSDSDFPQRGAVANRTVSDTRHRTYAGFAGISHVPCSLALLPVLVARAGQILHEQNSFPTGVTWIPTRSVPELRVIGHFGRSHCTIFQETGNWI